jgi:hypothetical protein
MEPAGHPLSRSLNERWLLEKALGNRAVQLQARVLGEGMKAVGHTESL